VLGLRLTTGEAEEELPAEEAEEEDDEDAPRSEGSFDEEGAADDGLEGDFEADVGVRGCTGRAIGGGCILRMLRL
jgi:hypothetical protein